MSLETAAEQTKAIHALAEKMSQEIIQLEETLQETVAQASTASLSSVDPFFANVTIFMLACFVGYYVVWKVTPALHSPLMSVTNAISSVIIVGALLGMMASASLSSSLFGFFAIVCAAVNIFGGFIITGRMLQMFSKNK